RLRLLSAFARTAPNYTIRFPIRDGHFLCRNADLETRSAPRQIKAPAYNKNIIIFDNIRRHNKLARHCEKFHRSH
ncbi:MAG: hypothetical protein ACLVCH_12540, partial [Roseburia inulinivorans]